jgi:hypothetical protein
VDHGESDEFPIEHIPPLSWWLTTPMIRDDEEIRNVCMGFIRRLLAEIIEMDNEFELYQQLEIHAKIMQDEAREAGSGRDTFYWQGVKDGLRRLYAALFNDPSKISVGGLSQDRPGGARDSWVELRAE